MVAAIGRVIKWKCNANLHSVVNNFVNECYSILGLEIRGDLLQELMESRQRHRHMVESWEISCWWVI